MSIAVSAIVRPSAGMRRLQAWFCLALGMSAPCCAYWWGLLPLAAAVAGWLMGRRATALRIDISGVGQLGLAVYQQIGQEPAQAASLLGGSTLWPWLLLLRVAQAEGRIVLLAVAPDSVTPEEFRALSLACRALAARGAAPSRQPRLHE